MVVSSAGRTERRALEQPWSWKEGGTEWKATKFSSTAWSGLAASTLHRRVPRTHLSRFRLTDYVVEDGNISVSFLRGLVDCSRTKRRKRRRKAPSGRQRMSSTSSFPPSWRYRRDLKTKDLPPANLMPFLLPRAADSKSRPFSWICLRFDLAMTETSHPPASCKMQAYVDPIPPMPRRGSKERKEQSAIGGIPSLELN